MSDESVNIIIRARDAATNSLKKAGASVKAFAANTIRSMVSLRGVLALTGFAYSIKKFTDAFIVQETAIIKLNQAIRTTNAAAGFSAKQLADYASSLQKTTVYGDEAIIEAEALLATFKQIQGPIFLKSTKAILDMSIAMGQDLKSSTVQIGKALNDPIKGLTALSRVGVAFSEEQKTLIKSFVAENDIASAQLVILKELSGEFGGQASASVNSFGGQIKQTANAWGDFKESLGEAISGVIPNLRKHIEAATFVVKNFGLSWDWLKQMVALRLVQIGEDLIHYIKSGIAWVNSFADFWVRAFVDMATNLKIIIDNIWSNIKNFFSALYSWIRGDGFDFEWTGLLDGFKKTVAKMPEIAARQIGPIEKAMLEELSNIEDKLTAKFIQDNIITNPIANKPGQQEPNISTSQSNFNRGVAANESRFLSLGRTTADKQLTEQKGMHQILKSIDNGIKQIAGVKPAPIRQESQTIGLI